MIYSQFGFRCATKKYFQIIGSIHDIESYFGIDNHTSLNVQMLFCHWGHLAIIFVWVSRNLFHIGWNGNYSLWVLNPIATIPIAHGIWDPDLANTNTSDYTIVLSSGIYNWLFISGFNSVFHLYNFVIICEFLAVISIPLGKVHLIYNSELLHWLALHKPYISISVRIFKKLALDINVHPLQRFVAYFDLGNLRLNFHTGIIIGFLSIAWCGHLVDVAIPISRFTLTFLGGLKSNTISLYLTDIAHHHLGVGILFVSASHLYLSFNKGFGHRIGDVFVNGNSGPMIRPLAKSLQLQLSLALAGSCLMTSVLAQQMYSLTPYLYLSYDYTLTVALYLHHSWIASFLMMATFAHAAIFLIRDYTSTPNIVEKEVIGRILPHKGAILSHLSWICLWLGFHTLGVYIHNDT